MENLILPLIGRISSGYGERFSPLTEKKEFHGGLDIVPTQDDTIYLPFDCYIEDAGISPTFGNRIWGRILTGKYKGLYFVLGHMASLNVREKTRYKAGFIAGMCGSTGNSTGKHLHFEIANSRMNQRTPSKPVEFIEAYEIMENESKKVENTTKSEPVSEKKDKKEPVKSVKNKADGNNSN
jgi:murein DD-endopeptidase MepM/ murein hydrolase activator NlpD